jgi:hypothetical protein
MSTMASALGGAGPLHEFEWEGKTYRVRYLDQSLKLAFQQHLFRQAREAIQLSKEDYGPETYAARLEALNDAYTLGEFAFESPKGMAFLNSSAGKIKLVSLMLSVDEMTALLIFKEKGDEIGSLIALVLRQSLRIKVDAPKNGETAEPAETPLPN